MNPRPQAFFGQFYMCSRLVCVLSVMPHSDTLHPGPVPYCLVPRQGTRQRTSPYKLPCSLDSLATALAQPIGQLLQGSRVKAASAKRSSFAVSFFSADLRGDRTSISLAPFQKPHRNQCFIMRDRSTPWAKSSLFPGYGESQNPPPNSTHPNLHPNSHN